MICYVEAVFFSGTLGFCFKTKYMAKNTPRNDSMSLFDLYTIKDRHDLFLGSFAKALGRRGFEEGFLDGCLANLLKIEGTA